MGGWDNIVTNHYLPASYYNSSLYRNTLIVTVIVAVKNTAIIESKIIKINNVCKMGDHCQGFFRLLIKYYMR
jgi:hypothetical protein